MIYPMDGENQISLNKYEKYAIIIIIIGAILRFFITYFVSPAGDGCWHMNIARFIARNNHIPTFELLGRPGFERPPLFYIFSAILYKTLIIFGNGAALYGLKLVSPITGSLTLLVVYQISKKLFNAKIGFYSVFFLAFLPGHIYYSTIPHIDVMITFIVSLIIYYIINGRYYFASIMIGIASLTNLNWLAILPVSFYAIYQDNKNKMKEFLKISVISSIILFIIGIPWYIRNYIIFKNPVWPFLNLFFKNSATIIGNTVVLKQYYLNQLLRIDQFALKFYSNLFGVPNENIKNIFFIKINFIEFMVFFWVVGTILFLIPFIYGLIKYDKKSSKLNILIFLIITYFLYSYILTIVNFGYIITRYMLPSYIAIAVFWAIGLEKLLECKFFQNKMIRRILFISFVFIVIGFVSIELIKPVIATKEWEKYQQDFLWIKKNTNNNSIIYAQGQCFAYYFDRQIIYDSNNVTGLLNNQELNITYVWVNQKFTLQYYYLNDNNIKFIEENSKLAYYNNKTFTKIYKMD